MSAMGCPACGGNERKVLGPGWFECRSRVADTTGNTDLDYRVCRHQYQEGQQMTELVCDCGVFAIGRCKACGRPICGSHSEQVANQLLCGPDATGARREIAARQEEDLKERRRQFEAAEHDWFVGRQDRLQRATVHFLEEMRSRGKPGSVAFTGERGWYTDLCRQWVSGTQGLFTTWRPHKGLVLLAEGRFAMSEWPKGRLKRFRPGSSSERASKVLTDNWTPDADDCFCVGYSSRKMPAHKGLLQFFFSKAEEHQFSWPVEFSPSYWTYTLRSTGSGVTSSDRDPSRRAT